MHQWRVPVSRRHMPDERTPGGMQIRGREGREAALYGFYDCGSIINPQAADMIEKLAAENDAKKPEWISVKDRLPEKKHEACLCCLDSCLFPGSQYIDIRVFYDDGKWANGMVTHWMPLPELPKEDER